MKQIPKKNIFKTPEGYFDHLADEILSKNKNKQRQVVLSRWAAAAILVVGFGLFIFRENLFNQQARENLYAVDQEVEFLIEQGDWYADDVLSMSEDPNAILDEIIAEEWGTYELNDTELEQDLWSY